MILENSLHVTTGGMQLLLSHSNKPGDLQHQPNYKIHCSDRDRNMEEKKSFDWNLRPIPGYGTLT